MRFWARETRPEERGGGGGQGRGGRGGGGGGGARAVDERWMSRDMKPSRIESNACPSSLCITFTCRDKHTTEFRFLENAPDSDSCYQHMC